MEHYGVETTRELDTRFGHSHIYGDYPPLSSWTKLSLPYEATTHPRIPSVEEIMKAREDDNNKLTGPFRLRQVYRVGNCVVKYSGNQNLLHEAENMLFLEKHSGVRTPKVYAVFSQVYKEPAPIHFIVMEYIEGSTLTKDRFLALDESARKTISLKIANQLKLLRSVPSEGYYGRVYQQAFSSDFPLLFTRRNHMPGPYTSYPDLLSAIYAAIELQLASGSWLEDYSDTEIELFKQFQRILGGVRTGFKPVLTHVHPKWQNTILQPVKGDNGEIKDWDVVLIDWNGLAWLPAYIQFGILGGYSVFLDDKHRKSFDETILDVLGESYPAEVQFMSLFQGKHGLAVY
jgi:hypothetical protein